MSHHVNVIASILNDEDNKAELHSFRSMSAPPSVVEEDANLQALQDEEKDDSFRADPAYYTYYYNQRLLNPRLPPPVVSWKNYPAKEQKLEAPQPQKAKPDSWVDIASKQKNPAQKQQAQQGAQHQQAQQRSVSSVVDRIQQDFPRTPSPVYTLQNGATGGATSTAPAANKANNGQHLFNQQAKIQQAGAQNLQPAIQPNQQRMARAPISPQQRAIFQDDALASQMQSLSLQEESAIPPQGHYVEMKQLPNPAMMQRMPMQQQYLQMGGQNPQIMLQQPDVMSYGFYNNVMYPGVFAPPQFVAAPTGQMAAPHVMVANYQQVKPDNRGVAQQKMYIGQQPVANPQMYVEPADYFGQQAWDTMAVPQQAPVPNYPTSTPSMKPEQKQRRNKPSGNNGNVNNSNNMSNNNSGNNNNNAIVNTGNNNVKQGEADFQPRSKLMEEFKGGKGRKWELKDIVGHVKEFSRDQYGSRFIQQKLETATAKEKEVIFEEIYPHALELMTDVFGNYVIQKFFEFGAPEQKKNLAKVLKGHVMALTLQTYGCRVIQKALEVIDEEDKSIIAEELNGHVMRCVQDQNGNHVIQKCIEKVPPKMIQFIVDSFVGNVASQAVHAYGCRVIQRILEFCSEKQAKPVLDEILSNAAKLVKDQYGNYVVQHVLERGLPKHKTLIIKQLKGQLVPLSQNKFASNVVEKCYENGAKRDKQEILDELMPKTKDPNTSPLFQMMRDQYANYVIQKIIELSDDGMRRQIIDYIKPHIAIVRRFTFAKHILACLEKFANEKF